MLKGAYKQILEVPLPQDEYFDRALLILKKDSEDTPQATLLHAAGWAVHAAIPPMHRRKAPAIIAAVLLFLLGSGAGLLTGWLLL